MRLICIALLAVSAMAQFNPPGVTVQPVVSDPTGNPCQNALVQYLTPNGTVFTCQNGTINALPVSKVNGLTVPTGAAILGTNGSAQIIPQPNLFINGLPLTGATFPAVRGYNLATGTTVLFTSPAGKRTLLGQAGGWNPSAGSITWSLEITSGAFTQNLTTAATVSTHTATAPVTVSIVLEPGDSLSVVTTTTAGLNISVAATQFDATSPLKTVKLAGLAAGDNTLYTVSGGKTAMVLPAQVIPLASANSAFNSVFDRTDTATWCAVAAGGATTCAANSVNQITSSGSVATTTRATIGATGVTLNAGDFIVVNAATGGAGELAWINVLEF